MRVFVCRLSSLLTSVPLALCTVYNPRALLFFKYSCCVAPPCTARQALIRRRVVRLRALVLLPSRDLAMQVHAVFKRYAQGTGLRVGLAIGQTNFLEEQLALVGAVALEGGKACWAHIVDRFVGSVYESPRDYFFHDSERRRTCGKHVFRHVDNIFEISCVLGSCKLGYLCTRRRSSSRERFPCHASHGICIVSRQPVVQSRLENNLTGRRQTCR